MGHVAGMLGLDGGAAGTGFAAPRGASLISPVTKQQATDAYNSNQQALTQQQAFLNAVQGQNGLQNQSSVYNQLQGVANGTGPNPALATLNQATGANTSNQAALMAGQRGAGANTGLIARQAAMQGGANQQSAAGQAATLQAQQSLNALQGMGNLATAQAGQQAQATGAVTGAQLAEQQALLNSIAGQNSSQVAMQSNINQGNAALAGQVMGGQQQLFGGILQGGAAALGLAEGGEVNQPQQPTQPQSGAKSKFAQFLHGAISTPEGEAKPQDTRLQKGGQQLGSAIVNAFKPTQKTADAAAPTQMSMDSNRMLAAEGGPVPALVSPGEVYLNPTDVKQVAQGRKAPMDGEKIPGKPKVKGAKNSYANDTVPKTLEEGGIVLPRSVTQAKHPHWEAKKFVEAILAKKGLPKK